MPAPKSLTLLEEITSRPWLMALMAAGVLASLWGMTRRPPPPPPEPPPLSVPAAPASEAPVAEAESPAPEMPVFLPPAAAVIAAEPETAVAPRIQSQGAAPASMPVHDPKALMGAQRPDGTYEVGPGVPRLR